MQTCRQSRLEVGADFGVSLLSQSRGPGALLWCPRNGWTQSDLCRVGARTGRAEALRPTTPVQCPRCSWSTPVALAVVVRSRCRYRGGDCHGHHDCSACVYGAAATLTKAGGVTVVLYAITMGRRYALRRVFEAWQARQVGLPLLYWQVRVRLSLATTPPLREAYNAHPVEATEPRARSVRG